MKKTKNKTITNKILSIFMSSIMISMSFVIAFSMSSTTTEALVWGCCRRTDDDWCSTTTADECSEPLIASYKECSEVSQCKVGVCEPPTGDMIEDCQAGKYKAECEAQIIGGGMEGRWYNAQTLDEVEQCQKGCCSVDSTYLGRVACISKAMKAYGITADKFDEYATHDTSIPDQATCSLQGGKARGCCVLSTGCKETNYEDCEALGGTASDFHTNIICSDITGCAITAKFKVGCGTKPGDENKICFFDSAGNQEDCATITTPIETKWHSCDFPTFACKTCGGQECIEEGENAAYDSVGYGEPYCKKISCNGTFTGSQQIELIDGKREITLVNNGIIRLRHGEELCYNFYGSFDRDDDPTNEIKEMYGKSTGLQNQVLRCYEGEFFIEPVDPERNNLCEPAVSDAGLHYTKTNIENKWQDCRGCGKDGASILNKVGDFWAPAILLGGILNRIISDHCTRETCEDIGNCVYNQDLGTAHLGSAPIGSCDPLYPPAVTGGEAGTCGGGGDDLWNVCSEEECYSLGNYQYKPLPVWRGLLTGFIAGFGAFAATRIALIPVDCAITATKNSATTIGLNWFPAFTTCLKSRVSKNSYSVEIATKLLTLNGLLNKIFCWASFITPNIGWKMPWEWWSFEGIGKCWSGK